MSADLWAGAEVQLLTTVAYLARQPGVEVSAVLFNDGPLASRLREVGIRVTILDERRLSSFAILRRLIRIFNDQHVDIVHTHRYKDTVLGAIAAKLARVPHLVRTVHGLREPMRGWSALKFRVYDALDRLALMWAGDLVVAVSVRMADALRSRGYRPTSVTCIHNGVDVSAIAASRSADDVRRELGIAPQAYVIGTIGRLSAVKGHATLLRAARLIRSKRRDTTLLIVGDGPLRRELEEEAARLGIADACIFAGARHDAYDLIGAMDLFALPSLSEGIPMAVLEAMALRCPVVASSVGGVPEIIKDDESGVLVEPGNEGALAAACLRVIGDPVYAMTLATGGRRTIVERFSSEHSGRALFAAYRSVALVSTLPRRGASPPPPTAAVETQIGPAWFCYESARLFAKRAARKIRHWIAKREVRNLRRNPRPLLEKVRRARTILMVCHGNIIRSPFAAELAKQGLNGQRRVSIFSAGLQAKPGNAVPPRALRMASGRHVDLASHTASPLTSELVAMSDLILVMDIPQLVTVRRRFPEARHRTFLLTCLAPGTPLEVADPVDGDEGMFHRCFEHITRATRPVVRAIATAHAE